MIDNQFLKQLISRGSNVHTEVAYLCSNIQYIHIHVRITKNSDIIQETEFEEYHIIPYGLYYKNLIKQVKPWIKYPMNSSLTIGSTFQVGLHWSATEQETEPPPSTCRGQCDLKASVKNRYLLALQPLCRTVALCCHTTLCGGGRPSLWWLFTQPHSDWTLPLFIPRQHTEEPSGKLDTQKKNTVTLNAPQSQ